MLETSPFRGLSWSFLGPTNISGRANDVAVADREGQRRIYVAYDGGGLWKTDDNGGSWQAVFTRAASTAIATVAVAPSNPDVVWLLTGASARSRPSAAGAGAFKSEDAGRTWQPMGLDRIGAGGYSRIVIHPTDPDIVYVAAQGGPLAAHDLRGVFKTTDGGKSWVSVFSRGPDVGVSGLVMDPTDPSILYASTRWRTRGNEPPLALPDSLRPSAFKTRDGGQTWTEIATGLPDPNARGLVDIGVSRSVPNVLYALVYNLQVVAQARPGETSLFGLPSPPHVRGPEIYRSDEAGASWRKMNPAREVIDPGTEWVHQIRVDPIDPNTIYTLGRSFGVSHDGGRTMQSRWMGHVDHNGLWIDPMRRGVLYDANDGGLFISEDGGRSGVRTFVPTAQFYDVAPDSARPAHVYGSVRDVGSVRRVIDLTPVRALTADAFEMGRYGGEDTHHAIDPLFPNLVYAAAGLTGRSVMRYDVSHWWSATDISPVAGPGEPRLRGAWMFSIEMSPHDPQKLYLGYQYLYRSRDRGDHWERISGDLTDNGPPEMQILDYSNQAIASTSESPIRAGLIYAGTDDGHLHVTQNDGVTWTDLTGNLPQKKWISRVVASGHAEGTLYVVQRGREDGDFAPYLYRSDDYGRTFINLVGNIPAGPVNVLREDPTDPVRLYAGTDFGAYTSTDAGAHWDVLGGNLPAVPVTDLQIHSRDRLIVIATYGAGLWALDAEAVPGAAAEAAEADLAYRDPREAAMVGLNAREAVWPDWVVSALLIVAGATAVGALACFLGVVVRLFRTRRTWWALLGLLFPPYAFVWGWLDGYRHKRRRLMVAWSALTVLSVGAVIGAVVVEFTHG